MVDMLRDEKSKWFEGEYQILATGDKQPEDVQPTKKSTSVFNEECYAFKDEDQTE